MSSSELPPQPTPIRRRELLKNINGVTIAPGIDLEGDELEDYCKKRGLCPLCAKTRVRKRVFKLFKKNKWDLMTTQDKQTRKYVVYKGYCVQPNCFSLDQAKRLAGDVVAAPRPNTKDDRNTQSNKSRRGSGRARSVMNGVNNQDALSDIDSTMGGGGNRVSRRRSSEAFPPAELRNTANFEFVEGEPMFAVQKTVEGLKENSSTITILDLSGLELRRVDYEALPNGLKVNTTLTSLILENSKLDDENLQLLAAGLDDANDIPLTKLYLRSNQVGDAGVNALCPFLQANVTLEKIDISRNCVSSSGALAMFRAFHSNRLTRIRCINLSHNTLWDLKDANFGITSFLGRNRTLRILNLEGNRLHDQSIQALVEGLKENDQTTLERLYLGWNFIGDEGGIALAEMLEKNTSLRVLGLGENSIQNIGARALLAAMDVNTSIKEISGLWRNKIDRRFIIVAIRRLLLSAERSDSIRTQLYEQAPSNNVGRMISTVEIESEVEEEGTPNFSVGSVAFANDPDYRNLFDSIISDDDIDPEVERRERERDRPLVPRRMLSPRPSDIGSRNGDTDSSRLQLLSEVSATPYDRLTVFNSAPLAYFDRESGVHRPIPLLDSNHENSVIKESLRTVNGGAVDVNVEVATVDRFNAFFARSDGHVMHFSCSGHPEHLVFENGYGSLHALPKDALRRLIAAVESNLRVVIVSSRHANSIAQAFLDAGVPHVVSCQLDYRYRDSVGLEFIQNFYRALATGKPLNQAFHTAQLAVASSPNSRFNRRITDRFQLLPERSERDSYHNIPVFFSQPISRSTPGEDDEEPLPSKLPDVPHHFLGREVVMYEILEALRVGDIVRIAGSPGNGKDSVVTAVCHYALQRRKAFSVDNIFWLPAPQGIVPEEDSLYGDLCLCVNILKRSHEDSWETDDLLLECRDRIEYEMEGVQAVLVVDERCFPHNGSLEGMEKFISFVLNVANAKVILLTSRSTDGASTVSHFSSTSNIEETNMEIDPLDFKSTASLFGGVSKFIASSGCPVAHDAAEFAELLEPPFVGKMLDASLVVSQRRSDLYARMGNGYPAAVVRAATTISKQDFIDLVGIAHRPEIFADSLGGLEKELRRRTVQKQRAIVDKNYLRAMDLDLILKELDEMRPEFLTLEDLRDEEELTKADLKEAVSSQRYDRANELKRELLVLKKKIMKEQRLLPGSEADKNANDKLNEFQAQVQTMMEESRRSSSSMSPGEREVTFAVQCDQRRDCSFVISTGAVHEFEHPSEARGIVCWVNESCDLEVTAMGHRLLELGGTALQRELDEIPVAVETSYGPARCGTGNAVIIGPATFGKLDVPCLILTVGPLTPSNLQDAKSDDDTDSLHFILSMLRSCYRSSMVLARHAELQAMALNLLTTRKTGQAYEQTLRIGLQTLVEEVKFSHLRDLHILASSTKEVSIITALLEDMGHRQI